MIKIHRSKQLVRIGDRSVTLTRDEHQLVTALAMMDNKLVPHGVLLEVVCEGRTQIPADRNVLATKLFRIRKKLGTPALVCKRNLGYQLTGPVEFIG